VLIDTCVLINNCRWPS